jgi:hypothetical protein
MPALTARSQMTVQGMTHLGYPVYFGTLLAVFKVLGAIVLVVPKIPARFKEWAYAGFGIDFICAFVSMWATDGVGPILLMPVVFFAFLAVSYLSFHKINETSAK